MVNDYSELLVLVFTGNSYYYPNHKIEVSWNRRTPKSSISDSDVPFFSMINQPFWGSPWLWTPRNEQCSKPWLVGDQFGDDTNYRDFVGDIWHILTSSKNGGLPGKKTHQDSMEWHFGILWPRDFVATAPVLGVRGSPGVSDLKPWPRSSCVA